jgi:sulfate transport system permease protein
VSRPASSALAPTPGALLPAPGPAPRTVAAGRRRGGVGTPLTGGFVLTVLSVVVLLPLAAVVRRAFAGGLSGFAAQVTAPQPWSALKLTVALSVVVAAVNLVMGTLLAWLLVRDDLPGRRVLDTLIDLPFALPTIVAGLTLLLLYGPTSPLGLDLAYARSGVLLALLFVTLPFVVRTVQPVLLELDRDVEEAAASLGAGPFTVFRRIVLPTIAPAMAAGTALAFARALSEFGSTVLISGNIPFKTQVAAVNVYGQIESDNLTGAAAVSTVLLAVAMVVLAAVALLQRRVARRG